MSINIVLLKNHYVMKKETKTMMRGILYIAFLFVLATGFTWWCQGDEALWMALFTIHAFGLVGYLFLSMSDHKTVGMWLLPVDAFVVFLLLQVTRDSVYWSPVVVTAVNALLVKYFVNNWKFDVTSSVIVNIVAYVMGYVFYFFVAFMLGRELFL